MKQEQQSSTMSRQAEHSTCSKNLSGFAHTLHRIDSTNGKSRGFNQACHREHVENFRKTAHERTNKSTNRFSSDFTWKILSAQQQPVDWCLWKAENHWICAFSIAEVVILQKNLKTNAHNK